MAPIAWVKVAPQALKSFVRFNCPYAGGKLRRGQPQAFSALSPQSAIHAIRRKTVEKVVTAGASFPKHFWRRRVNVQTEGNRVVVSGDILRDDAPRLLAAMHTLTHQRGYQDLYLDFAACTKAFAPEMLAICSQCRQYWKRGIDISLDLPNDSVLAGLFRSTNWAHLIDFRNHAESRYRGYTHSPALIFTSGPEQTIAVNKILDVLLAAITHFTRNDIRYIEWAVNEITDNVINHAQSSIGGIVQVTNIRRRNQIELVVADGGVGIPATLRPSHPELHSDTEALDAAIREGVTRDKKFGQGNGLYGTWRICQKTEGELAIRSGYASLFSPGRGNVGISQNSIPTNGTILSAKIGYGEKFDLSDALTFSGRAHVPTDYIDTHFEQDAGGNIIFAISKESNGFGSRSAGEPVRRKLSTLLDVNNTGKIVVDFSGVGLVSSSYADEVFGKLFSELGPMKFMSRIQFEGTDDLVQNLIDRAIMQRTST